MNLLVADLWRAKIATERMAYKIADDAYLPDVSREESDSLVASAAEYARLSDEFYAAYREGMKGLI